MNLFNALPLPWIDTMEYEGCYQFEPADRASHRPAKRRRIDPKGLHVSWNLRRKTYEQLWDEQHAQLDVRNRGGIHMLVLTWSECVQEYE